MKKSKARECLHTYIHFAYKYPYFTYQYLQDLGENAWYTHVPTETITLLLFLNGLVCMLSTICSRVWVSSCLSVSLQIRCWLWCAFPWKQAKPRSLVSLFSKLSYRDQLTSVSLFLGSEAMISSKVNLSTCPSTTKGRHPNLSRKKWGSHVLPSAGRENKPDSLLPVPLPSFSPFFCHKNSSLFTWSPQLWQCLYSAASLCSSV